MQKVNTLELAWTTRETKDEDPLTYLEFIVDGQPLAKYLKIEKENYVSPLGYGSQIYQETVKQEFKLATTSIAKSGNVMIYVCPTCGDIACGAITTKILRKGTFIIWTDFAFENNYESPDYDYCQEIPALCFNSQDYFDLF